MRRWRRSSFSGRSDSDRIDVAIQITAAERILQLRVVGLGQDRVMADEFFSAVPSEPVCGCRASQRPASG